VTPLGRAGGLAFAVMLAWVPVAAAQAPVIPAGRAQGLLPVDSGVADDFVIPVARALELLPLDAGLPAGAGVADVLRAGLRGDPLAARQAVALYEASGDVVGVLPEQDLEGGYRGRIHLLPRLPVGPERHHLEWLAAALLELDPFFAHLAALSAQKPRYRWRALELEFFASVKKRTPAAFASGWAIAYNVNGTLNYSQKSVRDLLFHELFHLNDRAHREWSGRALTSIYASIVERCGTAIACLTPYAPDPLIVHGGTYYSFMPGNGVVEYAADLALRYSREQRQVFAGEVVKHPFKCGPHENALAWRALVEEFFGGADAVPACP
jgi:hypothetical protein